MLSPDTLSTASVDDNDVHSINYSTLDISLAFHHRQTFLRQSLSSKSRLQMASTTMEHSNLSEFPVFEDGDVAIALSSTKVFRLHSSVLTLNSTFFATEIKKRPAAHLNKQVREESAVKYRFEFVKKVEPANAGTFIRKPVNERGRCGLSGLLPDLENGKVINEEYQHWEWLFGVFYNKQPNFDDDSLATLLSGCMGLIDVAESIGSSSNIHGVVDLAVLRQDETLWISIAANPVAWAELACRIHSLHIFKESVVHIVGRWNSMTEEEKKEMTPEIGGLCKSKFEEINVAKEAIEMRILGHYPSFLYRNATDKPGRPSYANDIYMWMAIDFFRQWFAQNISSCNSRHNADGGYKFYKQLATGGSAYLSHEDFANFHRYFPMSSKACAVLERDMGVLKEDVKKFVLDLMKIQIHLDTVKHPVEWLTCTQVEKEDCPWFKREIPRIVDEDVFFMESRVPARTVTNSGRPSRGDFVDDESPKSNGEDVGYSTDMEYSDE